MFLIVFVLSLQLAYSRPILNNPCTSNESCTTLTRSQWLHFKQQRSKPMNSKGRNSKPFGKISSLKRAQNSSFRKCKKKRFKRGKDKKATTSWKGRVRKCEGRDRKNLAKKQIQGQRGQRGQSGQRLKSNNKQGQRLKRASLRCSFWCSSGRFQNWEEKRFRTGRNRFKNRRKAKRNWADLQRTSIRKQKRCKGKHRMDIKMKGRNICGTKRAQQIRTKGCKQKSNIAKKNSLNKKRGKKACKSRRKAKNKFPWGRSKQPMKEQTKTFLKRYIQQ